MSRFISLYLLLIVALSPFEVSGSPLSKMRESIESLGAYEVEFMIGIGGGRDSLARGHYMVDGASYQLTLADQTIYSDGVERYSVDHTQHEVVIERVSSDTATPLLIANPAGAFTSMESDFNVDVISEDEDYIVLSLTPKLKNPLLDRAVLEIAVANYHPQSVSYVVDDELVVIYIGYMSTIDEAITLAYPDDYYIIDLRN